MTSPGGQSVGRIKLDVLPDTSKFARDARAGIRRALDGLNAQVPISANVNALRRDLQSSVRTAVQGVRATVPIDFIPGVAVLRARLAAIVAAASRGATARVDVDVDGAGLQRAVRSLTGSSGGGGPGRLVSALAGSFSALSKSVAGLAAAGSAVQVIGGLSAVMAQLAPIALALPGLLLGVGAAFAAVKIGLSGVGDAIRSGDLSGLAGPAAESVTALRSLKPALDDLKSSVQGALFEGLAGPLREAGTTLLPVLKTGLTGISTEFNGMGKAALAAVQSPFFQGSLTRLFSNTTSAVGNMRTSLGAALSGFVGLGAIGSDYLPRLGTALENVTGKFYAWVRAGEADGSIKTMIDGAIQGFRDLGAVLGNIGSSIGSVFSGLQAGMGGGGLLSNLVALTDQLARFLETAAAQDALRSLGELMATAGTAVREILGAALQALAPIVSALAPLIGSFATALSSALVPAFAAIGPPVAQLIGAFSAGLAPILPIVAQAFAGIAQALGPVISALVPVVEMLAAQMLPVFQMLLPFVIQIADAIGAALVTAIGAVTPFIPPLVQAVSDVLAAVLPLIPKLIELAANVFPILAGIIGNVVVPAVQFVAGVIEALAPIIGVVIDVLIFLAQMFSGNWAAIGETVRGAVDRIRGFIDGMIGFFRDAPGAILRALGNLGGLLIGAGRAILDGFLRGLKAAWGAVTDFVGGIATWIRNNKGPISYDRRLLTPAGKAIMDGLRRGLESEYGAVRSLVSGIAGDITGSFSEPIDVSIRADYDRMVSALPTASVESAWSGSINADGFGIDYDRLADSMIAGLTGSTLNVDGSGVAKLVNKTNTRKARRR